MISHSIKRLIEIRKSNGALLQGVSMPLLLKMSRTSNAQLAVKRTASSAIAILTMARLVNSRRVIREMAAMLCESMP